MKKKEMLSNHLRKEQSNGITALFLIELKSVLRNLVLIQLDFSFYFVLQKKNAF